MGVADSRRCRAALLAKEEVIDERGLNAAKCAYQIDVVGNLLRMAPVSGAIKKHLVFSGVCTPLSVEMKLTLSIVRWRWKEASLPAFQRFCGATLNR